MTWVLWMMICIFTVISIAAAIATFLGLKSTLSGPDSSRPTREGTKH